MQYEIHKIKRGQSLLNFCVEKYGSIERLADLVGDNDLSFDADPVAGTELKIDVSKVDQAVTSLFNNKSISIGNKEQFVAVSVGGIGTMIIGSTFKVK